MLPRAGKEFLVRIQFSWRPFFQGRYLLLTNTLSGGGMLALGDILQQSRETRKEPGRVRDWKRTGYMFVVGCSMGPLLHYWYGWLDRVYVGKAMKTVGKKVLVDQLIASPTIGMWYFLGMGLMEGHTLSKHGRRFKTSSGNITWQIHPSGSPSHINPHLSHLKFFFFSTQRRDSLSSQDSLTVVKMSNIYAGRPLVGELIIKGAKEDVR
uniref:MPV17 mitochondrial inner membrane protein like 2 n=1 Tax=Sparus aurata TaxID=8175 RepID=A0A671V6J9_SPAAU